MTGPIPTHVADDPEDGVVAITGVDADGNEVTVRVDGYTLRSAIWGPGDPTP